MTNREIDSEIAEKLMGWAWCRSLPEYRTGLIRRRLVELSGNWYLTARLPALGDEPVDIDAAADVPHYSSDIASEAFWGKNPLRLRKPLRQVMQRRLVQHLCMPGARVFGGLDPHSGRIRVLVALFLSLEAADDERGAA